MWSLLSLSLVSAFSEENGSVFALFMIHPSAGYCSSSLGVPGQCSSIPCRSFLTCHPLYPLLLCRHQPALLLPPLLTLCLSAFLPKPTTLYHSARGLPLTAFRALPLSSGSPSPASPIAYPLPSAHADFFSGCICISFLPS